jgi:transposase-like protein
MSTGSKRRHFSAQEKVTILKRHLVEKVSIADLCDELKINPNAIYKWLKLFFERAPLALENHANKQRDDKDKTIATLQAKLTQKNEVLAELMMEHVQLKKDLGEL